MRKPEKTADMILCGLLSVLVAFISLLMVAHGDTLGLILGVMVLAKVIIQMAVE